MCGFLYAFCKAIRTSKLRMYGPKLPELRGKCHPETEEVVAGVGGVAVAIGNTAVGGAVGPTAAAIHAAGAR